MKLKSLSLGLCGLVVVVSLSACMQPHSGSTVADAMPPKKMEASFQTKGKSEGKPVLALQKSSFGKLFLLRATVKSLKNAPSWEDMKPMIVSFQKTGEQIGMFEMDTYATYKVIDTQRLVAQFKVISENDSEVQFEWGDGLKIITRPFYDDATDKEDALAKDNKEGLSPSVESVASFVKAFDVSDNRLHIRQALRVKISSLKMKAQNPLKPEEKTPFYQTQESAAEVDYVLKPYEIHPGFQPKEADSLRRVGFFQTSVGKEGHSESKVVYAAHWDLSPEAGPITFALSKEFPAEVLDAVKQGIIYWNLVLGAEKIKVIDHFEPESEFPDRTVVVNWLPWTDAGASWANFQTDPLTGEIFRGQIYLTSVFLNLTNDYPAEDSEAQISLMSLSGMSSGRTCNFPLQAFTWPRDVSGPRRKQFVMDQLRHVVAHEAGHTLGLRHNFSASMDSELKASEINLEKKKYETDPNYPGAVLSSSIMDYIRGLEEGMIGRVLKHKALGYDVDALKWVSSNESEVKTKYAYCTDDDISNATLAKERLFGCDRFDAPSNVFNVGHVEIQRVLSKAVQSKFNLLLEAIYPTDSTEVRELDAVLQTDFIATAGSLGMQVYGGLVSKPLSYLYMESGSNSSTNSVYFKNRTEKRWDSVDTNLTNLMKAQLQDVGGLAPLINAVLPLSADGHYDPLAVTNQLTALKASTSFSQGVTSGGRSYSLSTEQQARIEKYLQKGVLDLDNAVATLIMSLKPYSQREQFEDGKPVKVSKIFQTDVGQEQWFPDFSKILKDLVLAQKEAKIEKLNGKEISYQTNALLSVYRKSVAEMMSPALWSASGVPKTAAIEASAVILGRLHALYSQLEFDADLGPPPGDKAADHKAFVLKLALISKIPASILGLVLEDIEILNTLESLN